MRAASAEIAERPSVNDRGRIAARKLRDRVLGSEAQSRLAAAQGKVDLMLWASLL